MINAVVAGAAGLFLAALLVCELTQLRWWALGTKTAASVLFVVAALLQPRPQEAYFAWVLGGLSLGLVGDVCLALPGKRSFLAGLVAFLLGHIAYVVAFAVLVTKGSWSSPVHALLVIVSAGVLYWLWPKLGSMRGPVIAYVIVITSMVAVAWTAFRDPFQTTLGGGTLLVGAIAFYLSDLFVARERFLVKGFANKLIGLPLYYAGQFLIAFSVGLVS